MIVNLPYEWTTRPSLGAAWVDAFLDAMRRESKERPTDFRRRFELLEQANRIIAKLDAFSELVV